MEKPSSWSCSFPPGHLALEHIGWLVLRDIHHKFNGCLGTITEILWSKLDLVIPWCWDITAFPIIYSTESWERHKETWSWPFPRRSHICALNCAPLSSFENKNSELAIASTKVTGIVGDCPIRFRLEASDIKSPCVMEIREFLFYPELIKIHW